MKRKRMKKLLMVFMTFWMLFSQCLVVRAQSDVIQVDFPVGYITDPNSKWAIGLSQTNELGNNYDMYGRFTINGQKVYCIEPLSFTDDGYAGYTASDLGVYIGNQELTQKLEYISALGYGFQGDTSMEMDFATQIRLWQEISPGLVTRIHPEIQAKIDQINARLKVMYTDVSFDGQTVTLHGYGKEFAQTLKDANGILDAYSVDSSSLHYEQKENDLTIWMEPGDSGQLVMNCFYPCQGTSIAYQNPTYQDVAYITGGTPNQLHLQANVQLGSIQIAKRDKDWAMQSPGEASLVNAKYEVIDNKTQKTVGTLTIQSDLTSNIIEGLPTDRTYTIREIEAPSGYLKDTRSYTVDLSEDPNIFLEVSDEVITGRFSIHKIISDQEHSQEAKPEAGAEFTAILKSYVDKYGSFEEALKHTDTFLDSEWDVLTTDEDGNATSKELAFGKYVLMQTKGSPEAHLLEKPISFEVKEADQEVIEYTVNNIPYTYYLRLVKVDKETGKPIVVDGATFKIFDEKGEPIKMKVGSKTYDTFKTASGTEAKEEGLFVAQEEEGTLTFPLSLTAGTYTIQEIASPKGYLIDSDPIQVQVGRDQVTGADQKGNPLIEIKIENERPKGKIILRKSFEGDSQEQRCEGSVVFQLRAKEDIVNPYDGSILYAKGFVITKDHKEGLYTLEIGKPLEIDNLEMGSYTLQEVQTLEGFQLYQDPIEFTFAPENDTQKEIVIERSIENLRTTLDTKVQDNDRGTRSFYQNEKVTLVDQVRYQGLQPDQEYILEGRIIDPETKENVVVDGKELVQSLRFSPEEANGTIEQAFQLDLSQWDAKKYVIYETLTCAQGHVLATHADPEDEDQQFTVLPVYDLKLYKVDKDTDEIIKQNEFAFELYTDKECQEKVENGIYDGQEGTFYWNDLIAQTYYLKEMQAPSGYQIDPKVYTVKVGEDGISIEDKDLSKEGDFYTYRFENQKIPQVPTSSNFAQKGLWTMLGLSGAILILIILLGITKKKN